MAAATTSAEQICNIALARIGCTETIDDLDADGTTESEACKVVYAPARDALLQSFPWRFARRRAVLALAADSAGDPLEFSGWSYVYALPSDFLHAEGLYAGTINPASHAKIPFEVELADDTAGNPTRPVLCTNQENAELFYTAQVTSPALMPPLFIQALAWLVAIDLCTALPKKKEWRADTAAGFDAAFARAGARNNSNAQPSTPPESEFITGRG